MAKRVEPTHGRWHVMPETSGIRFVEMSVENFRIGARCVNAMQGLNPEKARKLVLMMAEKPCEHGDDECCFNCLPCCARDCKEESDG